MNFKEKLSKRKVQITVLIALCFLAYANTLDNEFAWDDHKVILEWEEIKTLNNTILYFQGINPPEHDGAYGPLRTLAYAITYQLAAETFPIKNIKTNKRIKAILFFIILKQLNILSNLFIPFYNLSISFKIIPRILINLYSSFYSFNIIYYKQYCSDDKNNDKCIEQ